MPTWGVWWGGVGMVLTWAVWMFGSAVHYTFLPRCLSRSLSSVVDFAILQAALTGAVSWSMRRLRQKPKQAHQVEAGVAAVSSISAPAENRANILIAGAAFAVAITMTNASVAYGSVSGSRMIKSLEPAIVSGIQLLAGMDHRADFPWVCLLAVAVSIMLAVAPTGITMLSAAAALMSTAGISTRNVFVKKHMLAAAKGCATSSSASEDKPGAGGAQSLPGFRGGSRWTADAQTSLNFVACAILIAIATGSVALGGWGSSSHTKPATLDVVIASGSFAAFQVAALMVLERVTPTRQAAIKSLQNALTTAWTLVIDSKGKRHSSLEIVPALVWGVCVAALTMDAQMGAFVANPAERQGLPMSGQGLGDGGSHNRKGDGHGGGVEDGTGKKGGLGDGGGSKPSGIAANGGSRHVSNIAARAWLGVYCACAVAILLQCAAMAFNASVVSLDPLRNG